jgi:hypothetical protein
MPGPYTPKYRCWIPAAEASALGVPTTPPDQIVPVGKTEKRLGTELIVILAHERAEAIARQESYIANGIRISSSCRGSDRPAADGAAASAAAQLHLSTGQSSA